MNRLRIFVSLDGVYDLRPRWCGLQATPDGTIVRVLRVRAHEQAVAVC